ncbi:MAG: hypothetical protein WCI31_01815 [Prolixibacteraceae bacterium]
MDKKILYFVFSAIAMCLTSCENDDKVKDISRDGAIETIMNVEHLNAKQDVIKTTHKIWVNSVLVKTAVHTDTIPSLGIMKTETAITEDVSKEIDVKKDYEFYITVK